ncbi:MAG: two component transcriptional regulator, winged helix family [Bacteroidetes bacterium]|jgi:two-component system KDP operon response regulator KdpE|nr:two component transcriptional regulator, winged helix family [Bacteroidota bacterium]
MTKPVVLVVDDEVQIRRLLQLTLESEGYKVVKAETGEEGIRRAVMDRPDLIVLDLGLPDMDGTGVLKKLREWATTPIIILSVRNSETEIIACLDAGADDYLVKPYRSGELLARVRTAIRHRPSTQTDTVFRTGDLEIDLVARTVKKSEENLKLTATEFNLLSLFVRNAGRVLTHRYILEQVWGPTFVEETEYTRVYVGQLRKKIEDSPGTPKMLITESGIGYRLVEI